ncbi:MAG: hypothetical protein MUP85_16195, partial [Candidatus Lokiarchaeota archaeon]|nr:hypothetical protein [Candidatus Lokiarchaeota archaeon]
MLFQLDAIIMSAIIIVIVIAIIMFFIGIKLMQWYAKKNEWDPSFKTAAIVNVVWFVLDLILGILFSFLPGEALLYDLL